MKCKGNPTVIHIFCVITLNKLEMFLNYKTQTNYETKMFAIF